MKGTLVFNLPEDQEQFLTAQNAIGYKSGIEAILNAIRANVKYNEDKPLPQTWDDMRDWIWEILEEDGCPPLF